MEKLCILITTCKHYFSNIPHLIQQINKSDFPKQNIIIVSGQEDSFSTSYIDGIKIIKVYYSGLHLTGAININENINLYNNIKYWMLLPDTIKFGENFFNNVRNYCINNLTNDDIYSFPFINPCIRPTMDMGIIHTNHILNMSDYLNKIKTYDTCMNNLKQIKKQLINDEDTILGLIPPPHRIQECTKHASINLDEKQIKFLSNERINIRETLINDNKINEVYFELLDLYKYQRNFNGLSHELIMTL